MTIPFEAAPPSSSPGRSDPAVRPELAQTAKLRFFVSDCVVITRHRRLRFRTGHRQLRSKARTAPRHSHSRRLLILSRLSRLSARRYYAYRGGPGARPPSPPVSAFGEIETAYLAGFRSLRAWRKARRYGGFPEPTRVTPQGPLWTAAQIAQWLGAEWPGLDGAPGREQDDAVISDDEAALLAEIDRLELPV